MELQVYSKEKLLTLSLNALLTVNTWNDASHVEDSAWQADSLHKLPLPVILKVEATVAGVLHHGAKVLWAAAPVVGHVGHVAGAEALGPNAAVKLQHRKQLLTNDLEYKERMFKGQRVKRFFSELPMHCM